MTDPQPATEEQRLLTRLEQALHGTGSGFKLNGVLVCGLFFVIALTFAVQGHWGAAGFGAFFGVAICIVMVLAVRRNAPEKMRPAFNTVRDAPETVMLIHHYQTSDTRRVFVTDWVLIKAPQGHLLVKANDDWRELIGQLHKRCPNAKVTGV